jgi:hypothetical protein
MQRCPKCKRTYIDDKQKFCTFDGGRLAPVQDSAEAGFDPEATMLSSKTVMDQPASPEAFDPFKTIAASPDAPTGEFKSAPTGSMDSDFTENQQTVASLPSIPMPPPPAQQSQGSGPQQPPLYSSPDVGHPIPTPSFQPQGTGNVASQMPPVGMAPEPVAQQAPRKSSKVPLVLGLFAVVVILGIVGLAAIFFVFGKPWLNARRERVITAESAPDSDIRTNSITLNGNTTQKDENSDVGSSATSDQSANSNKFESSLKDLDPNLSAHFVDFSFYYPASWHLKRATNGSSNFVEVDRSQVADFSQENLVVSWYKSNGTLELDREGLPKAAESLSSKFSKTIPSYEKVSEGETNINGTQGYEFRFTGFNPGTNQGDIKIWGRAVFLPPGIEGEEHGLTLIMLTTSLAPEIHSVEDVGVKGQMPVIVNSFRMER